MRRDSPPGLLLIDSEPAQAGLISALAQRAGWRVLRAPGVDSAADLIRRSDIRLDAALIDIWSPGEAAVRAVGQLKGRFADLPIIVVTAQDSVDLAVRAIRAGCDVLLLCRDERNQRLAEEALIKECERDSAFRAQVGTAAARVRAMKRAHAENQARRPALPRDVIGSAAHRALADRLTRA